ncbi:hypothetical protein [Ramlibacter sp.]|uniref:hypothetical protein n=1 Tax=Ramlibacter sp. TaxID=1917967 RepID=UPI0017F4C758|nr:hypothetical protein [Ramlibacter sp.]MBA2672437.1 hypothetical protein [Ramlibacter sp.]
MRTLNIAAYGEGILYAPTLKTNMAAIQSAGWTSIILGLFHIRTNGTIVFNGTDVVAEGRYVGDPSWPALLAQLSAPGGGNTIGTLLASVGGGGVVDFATLQAIYEGNGNSFKGTMLEANFKAFHEALPAITLIDMDVEDNYDLPSFISFCQMLARMGYGLTFCPYRKMPFWTDALQTMTASHPGAVKWWNLQCYDGGSGNDPGQWAQAIAAAIPGFDTTGFLLVSDWSRFLAKISANPADWYWAGDCPPAMQQMLSQYKGQPSVGGGFLWTLDQIIDYAADQREKPDPAPCGSVDMLSYTRAMLNALG